MILMDLIQEIRERTKNSLLAYPKPKELDVNDLTELEQYATKLEKSIILYQVFQELKL